jgi:hypothetical protein
MGLTPRPTPNLEDQVSEFVPRRQGGPAIPPGTGFPFQSPLTTRWVILLRSHTENNDNNNKYQTVKSAERLGQRLDDQGSIPGSVEFSSA